MNSSVKSDSLISRRVLLGQTGIEVSPLAMGAIQITRLNRKEGTALVREVVDMGINLFDTAEGYLDSESILGEAFEGIRDKVVICTKSGAQDPKILRAHIDKSLKQLKTDYLDVFMFHGAGAVGNSRFLTDDGLLQTALDAVTQGKIRFLGFSTHRIDLGLRALDISELKVCMIPGNFISDEYIDGSFIEKARDKKCGILIMKPFGGGRIRNPEICLKYLKGYKDIIPCIGIEKSSEMEQNIRIWESNENISDDDVVKMDKIKELLGDKFCRGCGYCMPCPEDISITTMTFLKILAKQMPHENVFNDAYTKMVNTAKNCTECRKCVKKCPYDLQIPELIKENIKFYESNFDCIAISQGKA